MVVPFEDFLRRATLLIRLYGIIGIAPQSVRRPMHLFEILRSLGIPFGILVITQRRRYSAEDEGCRESYLGDGEHCRDSFDLLRIPCWYACGLSRYERVG